MLKKRHGDEVVEVKVTRTGFTFRGRVYRSLSAVAREVTGARWNGLLWFGLTAPAARSAAGTEGVVILYQPTWKTPDGTQRRGRVWWVEATVAGKRYRRSLGVRDKHAAQARAAEIVRSLELQAAGIHVDAEARPTPRSKGLIDAYEQELIRRRSSPQHVARTVQRLHALLDRATRLSDVTPEYVRKALGRVASGDVTPQTVNAYRVAAHAFFAWLVREDRWGTNPISKVARVRSGESTRQRRALAADEVERLVQDRAPPPRCLLPARGDDRAPAVRDRRVDVGRRGPRRRHGARQGHEREEPAGGRAALAPRGRWRCSGASGATSSSRRRQSSGPCRGRRRFGRTWPPRRSRW